MNAGNNGDSPAGPVILIATSRNFTIRYLLYSDIMSTLEQAGARFVLVLRDGDLDYYREKFSGRNVVLEPLMINASRSLIRSTAFGRIFTMARGIMNGGGGEVKNTTVGVRRSQIQLSGAIGVRALLERFTAIVLGSLGSRLRFLRNFFVRLEGWLMPGRNYDDLFRRHAPDTAIVSSLGFGIDPLIMRSARRNGCPVISIIHSWDNPSTKGYRGADADLVITWNEAMKQELRYFHDIPERNIEIGGVAHWDFYFDGRFEKQASSRDEFFRRYDLDPRRRLLFYGAGSNKNFPRTFDVIEGLLERMAAGELAEPAQVLMRLHPAYLDRGRVLKDAIVLDEYRDRMEQLSRRFPELVRFNIPRMKVLTEDIDMPPEDMQDLAEMIHFCDALLNEYSTLMIEGAVFDVPVINVGLFHFRDTNLPAKHFEEYYHIRRILDTEAFDAAYSFEDLVDRINSAFQDPGARQAGRRRLVDRELAWNRGTAGRRIASMILDRVGAGGNKS